MRKFLEKVAYIFSLRWIDDIRHSVVDAGICDFSGEGKNKYGK